MRPDEQTFQHIVVIGASAGGVDSLSVLVSTLHRQVVGGV